MKLRRIIRNENNRGPVFSIILFLLNLAGLCPEGEGLKGKCGLRAIILLTILHCYFVFVIASTLYYVYMHGDIFYLVTNALSIVRCFSSVITMDFFFKRSRLIWKASLSVEDLHSPSRSSKHFHQWFAIFAFVSYFLYYVICIRDYFGNYASSKYEAYIDAYCFGAVVLKDPFNKAWLCLLMNIFYFLYVFVSYVSYVVQIFFALLAIHLRDVMLGFAASLRSEPNNSELWKIHSSLFSLVHSLESCLSLPFTLWLLEWMLGLGLNVPLLRSSYEKAGLFEVVLLDTLVPFFLSIYVSTALSEVHSANGEIISQAGLRLARTPMARTKPNFLLLSKLQSVTLQFRILKCTVIHKMFILSMYAVLTTYFLFIVQQFHDAQQKTQKLII